RPVSTLTLSDWWTQSRGLSRQPSSGQQNRRSRPAPRRSPPAQPTPLFRVARRHRPAQTWPLPAPSDARPINTPTPAGPTSSPAPFTSVVLHWELLTSEDPPCMQTIKRRSAHPGLTRGLVLACLLLSGYAPSASWAAPSVPPGAPAEDVRFA